MSLIVGVTGAFCSGKTSVCTFFRRLGALVIDADRIVHELYEKDEKIKKAILKEFGKGVFTRGRINRRKLAGQAFKTRKRLKRLCGIIHPPAVKQIKKEVRKARNAVIVLDAPLLVEARLHTFVDRVIIVRSNIHTEIRRCMKRGFTKHDLYLRRAAQIPMQKKLKIADFIIYNTDSIRETGKEVRRIWEKLTRG